MSDLEEKVIQLTQKVKSIDQKLDKNNKNLKSIDQKLNINDRITAIAAIGGAIAAIAGTFISFSSAKSNHSLESIESSVQRNFTATELVTELIEHIADKKNQENRDLALLTLDSTLSADLQESNIKRTLLHYKITRRLLKNTIDIMQNSSTINDADETKSINSDQSILRDIHLSSAIALDQLISNTQHRNNNDISATLKYEIKKMQDYININDKHEQPRYAHLDNPSFELAATIRNHSVLEIPASSAKSTTQDIDQEKEEKNPGGKSSNIQEQKREKEKRSRHYLAAQSAVRKVIYIYVNSKMTKDNLKLIRTVIKEVAAEQGWTAPLRINEVENFDICKSLVRYYYEQDQLSASQLVDSIKEYLGEEKTGEFRLDSNPKFSDIEEDKKDIVPPGQFDVFFIEKNRTCSN